MCLIAKCKFSDLYHSITDEMIEEVFTHLDSVQNRFYPDKFLDFLDLWSSINALEGFIVDINNIKNVYKHCVLNI